VSEIQTSNPQVFDLTLLANFVHQIVNPLNGVAGTLDNLSEGLIVEKSRQDQRLKAARAQIEQCITLLRNLAFLAQGSGGVADNERRVVVIPQVIIESAMFFQEDGKTKKIEISLKDRNTQNKVSGHPELIRQVLMNIFDNCIKYGEFGSEVTVNQFVNSNNEANILIVGQSKIALSTSDIEQIFELGFRGANARQIIASGTGLGMYICKQIVEKSHGGKLHVQAHGKSGLEFLIKLPNAIAG